MPPARVQVDANVAAFCVLDPHNSYILGRDGNLWLAHPEIGSIPPPRTLVDGNVAAFDPIDDKTLYILGFDGKLWLTEAPFGKLPPKRTLVNAIGLPPTLDWSGGAGFGSGPSNANFHCDLALAQDGKVRFSGVYNDTGSVPLVTSPTQNWTVAAAIAVGSQLLTFSASGSTPSASSSNWSTSATSSTVSLLWPLLVGKPVMVKASNSESAGTIFTEFVGVGVQVIEVVVAIAD